MVENSEKDPPTMGHSYDGIEELDNRLPTWWLATLYGSIIFAIGYFGYYVLGSGPTLVKEYERGKAEAEYIAYLRGDTVQKGLSEAELIAIYKDVRRQKEGQVVFAARCVACHGEHGQGGIGPNLTDEYWLHGAKLTEIEHTLRNGVLDKGMPPWGSVLKDQEIHSVVAFIRSLHGSKPAGAKAPQGEHVVIAE
jgi:cytochrome c oxidase cbb3-type subunit 3